MPARPETIGQRIKRRRQELGLSQHALAGDGVSNSYLSYIEADNRNPSVKALRYIAERLDVTADYLETGRDETTDANSIVDAELELRLGDPDRAVELLEEALRQATHDNSGDVARVRASLVVGYANSGAHQRATTLYETSAVDERPSVAIRPDLYTAVGQAYAAQGDAVQAAAHFRSCLSELEALADVDDALFVRFSTQLSYALTDCGHIAAANSVLVKALERGSDVRDPQTELRLQWSLGRLYATNGQADLAAHYLRRAIALCELTEDRFHLAAGHETLASALLDQGSAVEALPHLEIAEDIYSRLGDKARVGMVTVERARHSLQTGDHDGARDLALSALDLLESGNAPHDASGDAWRTLGELYTEIGDYELAEHCLRTAITALESAPVKYRADAYRSLALLLEATGREREALRVMWVAADLGTQRKRVDSAPDAELL